MYGELTMPIYKVKGGYRWGKHGKVYKDRKDAVRQAAAAYANGYKEKKASDINMQAQVFVKAAVDRMTSNGLNEDRAIALLDRHLEKKARELGLYKLRRNVIEDFKKKAGQLLSKQRKA